MNEADRCQDQGHGADALQLTLLFCFRAWLMHTRPVCSPPPGVWFRSPMMILTTRDARRKIMSDRTRLVCIVLTILCIIAVLVEKCQAEGEVERLCARYKAQVRAMVLMEERSRTSYGDSYIPSTYYGQSQSQEQTVVNNNINRNTVIVETPEPYYYYYPVYRDDWSTRQHFYQHNRNTRR
jgi:hypothetical protein